MPTLTLAGPTVTCGQDGVHASFKWRDEMFDTPVEATPEEERRQSLSVRDAARPARHASSKR